MDGVEVFNSGTVQVDADATLTINGTVTLDGGGDVTLAAGSALISHGDIHVQVTRDIVYIPELDNVDNTISGAGTIGDGSGDLTLSNDATAPSMPMFPAPRSACTPATRSRTPGCWKRPTAARSISMTRPQYRDAGSGRRHARFSKAASA